MTATICSPFVSLNWSILKFNLCARNFYMVHKYIFIWNICHQEPVLWYLMFVKDNSQRLISGKFFIGIQITIYSCRAVTLHEIRVDSLSTQISRWAIGLQVPSHKTTLFQIKRCSNIIIKYTSCLFLLISERYNQQYHGNNRSAECLKHNFRVKRDPFES